MAIYTSFFYQQKKTFYIFYYLNFKSIIFFLKKSENTNGKCNKIKIVAKYKRKEN